MEIFETLREFNNKYPTKTYTCPMCKSLTINPYQCDICNFQANNLTNLNYTYHIKELNLTDTTLYPNQKFLRHNTLIN